MQKQLSPSRETYDPKVLATWRAYGTRGDAAKAYDLYAKAYDGGIQAAKDRSQSTIISEGDTKAGELVWTRRGRLIASRDRVMRWRHLFWRCTRP